MFKNVYLRYLLVIVALFFSTACKKENPEEKFSQLMTSAENYKEQEKYNEARIELQNAIDVKPKSAEAHFRLGEILVRLGKIPKAVDNYSSAINLEPTHREARLHLAAIMLAARQYELAESHVTKLLEMNPKDVEGLIIQANLEGMGPRKDFVKALEILKGIQYREPENVIVLASMATYELASQNPTRAEELYQKSLALSPENTAVKMALADLYTRQGRLDEAEELIKNVVDANPEASSLRYVFGEFLLRRGQGGQALEQYKVTLSNSPKNHRARDRLYDLYLTRGKPEEAKKLVGDLAKSDPNDPGLKYFRGRNLELEGKREEALASYLDGITILNDFAAVFRRAGKIEVALGKVSPGIEHLSQAISLDEGDVAARYALARALFFKRELVQSKDQLEKILRAYPRHLGANVLRADIAVIENEPIKAEKVYEFLLKAFPKSPIGYFKKAVLEERKGNTQIAIDWYRKTLAFDQNILPPARRLVALLGKQRMPVSGIIKELQTFQSNSKTSKAEYSLMLGTLTLADRKQKDNMSVAKEYLHKAIEGNPKLVGAYFALGAIDSIGGNLDAAAANYEKLIAKDPKHVPTLMLLALTREKQGQYDKAIKAYKDILSFAPRFGPAANNLAWIMAEELEGADLDEALRLAKLAKEEMPGEASVTDTLGWIYVLQGSPRLGLAYLEEAVSLYKSANPGKPENAEMLYHLATAFSKTGEAVKAQKALERALKMAGDKHPKLAEMKNLEKSL